MYRFFVDPDRILGNEIRIGGSDYNHIRNVLRMKPGEVLRVCTGKDDIEYRCELDCFEQEEAVLKIMWEETGGSELPAKIHLFQGLPKSDKMEWIIQKAVELGACRIIPVAMHRSVVKLTPSKAEGKCRRWNAVSESAAKQSKRMVIPEVAPVMGMQEAVESAAGMDLILLPYELAEDMEYTRNVLSSVRPGQSIAVFIGPEGGFEPEEANLLKEQGARVITLGQRILRTETAGMAVLAALMLQLDGR